LQGSSSGQYNKSTASGAPSYSTNDTLQDSNEMTVTGSGSSGSVVGSSATNYGWQNTLYGSADNGSGASSWSQSSSASLPQGVLPLSPDGTSVPVPGGQSPGLSLLTTTGAWMSLQGGYASQVSNNGAYLASSNAPVGGNGAMGAPGGSGESHVLFTPGQTLGSGTLMSYNPATGSPTVQLGLNKLPSLENLETNPWAALPGSGIS